MTIRSEIITMLHKDRGEIQFVQLLPQITCKLEHYKCVFCSTQNIDRYLKCANTESLIFDRFIIGFLKYYEKGVGFFWSEKKISHFKNSVLNTEIYDLVPCFLYFCLQVFFTFTWLCICSWLWKLWELQNVCNDSNRIIVEDSLPIYNSFTILWSSD